MNTAEEIRKIQNQLGSIERRLTDIREGGGGGGPHNILSTTHADALTQAVVRGDLIVGNSTPKWERIPRGSDDQIFRMDGLDPVWEDLAGTMGEEDIAFYDAFNDGSVHWAWAIYTAGLGRTAIEAGGVMTLHTNAGVKCDFWTTGNDGPQVHVNAPQWPMTIVCKVDHDGAVPNLCEFGLFANCRTYLGATNGCHILGRRRLDASGNNGIYASRWGTALGNVDPMTTLPVWLRIRTGGGHRIRSTTYFDYSINGVDWINITSDNNSGMYPATYGFTHGLYIRSWATPYPQIDAQFDFFKMWYSWGPGEAV